MSMVVVMAVTMVLAGRREVVGLESCSRGEVVAAARNGGRRQRQATAPQPRRAREAVAASLRKSVDATALRRRLRRRVGVKGETGAARADGAQGKDNLGLGGESRRQGRRTQTRKQRGAAQSATATVCDGGGDRQGRPQRRRCPLPFPHGDTSVWRAATTGRGGDGAASRTGSADRAGGHDTNADDGGGWKMGDGGARFMHPTPLLPPSPTLVPEGGGGGCRSPLLPRVPPCTPAPPPCGPPRTPHRRHSHTPSRAHTPPRHTHRGRPRGGGTAARGEPRAGHTGTCRQYCHTLPRPLRCAAPAWCGGGPGGLRQSPMPCCRRRAPPPRLTPPSSPTLSREGGAGMRQGGGGRRR